MRGVSILCLAAMTAALAPPTASAPPPTALAVYEPLQLPRPSDLDRTGVRATFMGTSTLLLDDGITQILVDGFFSRPGWIPMAMGTMTPKRKRIEEALDRGGVTALQAVMVAHTHHDHALDSADVATMRGPAPGMPAVLIGSRSLAMIARGRGFPVAKVWPAPTGQDFYSFGDFTIRAIDTAHSPTLLPASSITRPLGRRAHLLSYKMGPNYAFVVDHGDLRILIYPCAPKRPTPLVGLDPDVVFLGVGALGKQDQTFAAEYWQAVVGVSRAPVVIPIHWDDFTRPFTFPQAHDPGRPLKTPLRPLGWPLDDALLGLDRVRGLACASAVELRMAPAFVPVVLRPNPPLTDPNRTLSPPMATLCEQSQPSKR